MGILGLGTFLRKRCPAVFKELEASSLRGCRVALDMHLYTYQMFFRNGGNETALGRDMEQLVRRLRRDGIDATFVFDGNTVGKKTEAHKKRREAAGRVQDSIAAVRAEVEKLIDSETESDAKLDAMLVKNDVDIAIAIAVAVEVSIGVRNDGDVKPDECKLERTESETKPETETDVNRRRTECDAKLKKLELRAMKPTQETFADVKAVLAMEFGEDSIVIADDDAERHVAELCRRGDVEYAASGDYDTLVFGSPNVIIDFLKPDAMLLVSLDDVVTGLNLQNVDQFRDFCILCGCDFCEKIPGVGPVAALKLVTTHGCIDAVYATPKFRDAKRIDYVYARRRFASDPSLFPPSVKSEAEAESDAVTETVAVTETEIKAETAIVDVDVV